MTHQEVLRAMRTYVCKTSFGLDRAADAMDAMERELQQLRVDLASATSRATEAQQSARFWQQQCQSQHLARRRRNSAAAACSQS
jgi:hypothetical protein